MQKNFKHSLHHCLHIASHVDPIFHQINSVGEAAGTFSWPHTRNGSNKKKELNYTSTPTCSPLHNIVSAYPLQVIWLVFGMNLFSNFGQDFDCTDSSSCGFPQPLKYNGGTAHQLCNKSFLPNPFQPFIYQYFQNSTSYE